MSSPQREPAGLGWSDQPGVHQHRVTLTGADDGVVAERQRLRHQHQQRLAAETQVRATEAARDGHPGDLINVRIQWVKTTRYEADVWVDPWSNDEDLRRLTDRIGEDQRRTLDMVAGDQRLISVIDLDGDGHLDPLELSIAGGNTIVDWGDVADRIDEHIAESPSWPRLNAELAAADARGYDVATELPAIAAMGPLPAHDPADELYYRLLGTGITDTAGDPGANAGDVAPQRRDEPPGGDPPRINAPEV